MLQTVQTINAYLSDYVLVFLLVAVGLWVFIEFIMILMGSGGYERDSDGYPLQ